MSKIGALIRKSWFFVLIVVIIVIFVYQRTIALLITLVLIFTFIISYIPSLSFKKRLIKLMNKYKKVEDVTISRKIRRPLPIVQNYMYKLSKRQKRRKWLIVYLNKRYIFYNKKTIQEFLKLYGYGFREKEILENLRANVNLKTRAEIKAIRDTLVKNKRVSKSQPQELIEEVNLHKSIEI
jgi:c-di-AMP phosphodiesterase-like protein